MKIIIEVDETEYSAKSSETRIKTSGNCDAMDLIMLKIQEILPSAVFVDFD